MVTVKWVQKAKFVCREVEGMGVLKQGLFSK